MVGDEQWWTVHNKTHFCDHRHLSCPKSGTFMTTFYQRFDVGKQLQMWLPLDLLTGGSQTSWQAWTGSWAVLLRTYVSSGRAQEAALAVWLKCFRPGSLSANWDINTGKEDWGKHCLSEGERKLQPFNCANQGAQLSFICMPWSISSADAGAFVRPVLVSLPLGDLVRTLGPPLRDGPNVCRQSERAAAYGALSVTLAYAVLIYVAVMGYSKCVFWWQALYQLTVELVVS